MNNSTCFFNFSLVMNDSFNLLIIFSSSSVNRYGFFSSTVGKLHEVNGYSLPFIFTVCFLKFILSSNARLCNLNYGCLSIICFSSLN